MDTINQSKKSVHRLTKDRIPHIDDRCITANKCSELRESNLSVSQTNADATSLNGSSCYIQLLNSDGKVVNSDFSEEELSNFHYRVFHPNTHKLTNNNFLHCYSCRDDPWYMSWNVCAQLKDKDKNPITEVFRVNSYSLYNQSAPVVCQLPEGCLLICWQSRGQDLSEYGVYAKRFDANAHPMESEFRINTTTKGSQVFPCIANLKDSTFIICWDSMEQEHFCYQLYGKRLPIEPIHHTLRSFNLLYPQNDFTVRKLPLTLSWQPASDQMIAYPWELEYTVYYDTNPDFRTAFIQSTGIETELQFEFGRGKTWFWKVLAKNFYGDEMWSDVGAFFIDYNATGVEETTVIPEQFIVHQNYPNPFNPSTTIQFELPEPGTLSLKIYDIQGRVVYDAGTEHLSAGQHSRVWDGVNNTGEQVAAGVYFYQVEYQSQSGQKQVMMKKMSLVR